MTLIGSQWSNALRLYISLVDSGQERLASNASASHHHLHESIATDLALPIEVAALPVIDILTHDLEYVLGADEAIAIAVEDIKCLDELLFLVCLPRFPLHQ